MKICFSKNNVPNQAKNDDLQGSIVSVVVASQDILDVVVRVVVSTRDFEGGNRATLCASW